MLGMTIIDMFVVDVDGVNTGTNTALVLEEMSLRGSVDSTMGCRAFYRNVMQKQQAILSRRHSYTRQSNLSKKE